jgi:hypothetical protein
MKSAPHQPVCGAKKRNGEPCQKLPIIGKKRCRLHGGATPKGIQNARKHGVYRKTLSDEEQELWTQLQVGNLDNEILFMKIMFNRAIELNADVRKAPNDPKNMAGFELTEINRASKGSGKTDINSTSKRPDSVAMLDRIAGRIASLEKTRMELIAAAAGKGNDPTDSAEALRAALKAMIAVETTQKPIQLNADHVPNGEE